MPSFPALEPLAVPQVQAIPGHLLALHLVPLWRRLSSLHNLPTPKSYLALHKATPAAEAFLLAQLTLSLIEQFFVDPSYLVPVGRASAGQ